VQRRVQRTRLDLEQILRRSLDMLGNGVAVGRSEKQCAEDEEVERTLKKFDARE
jgi:hypothetical protein